MTWLRIDQQKPDQKQPVFYYFGVFDCVYEGFYITNKLDFGEGRVFDSDCFYGDKGCLGDDVTYWQPRAEGQERPAPPSLAERRECLYHRYSYEEEQAALKRKTHLEQVFEEITPALESRGFKIKQSKK